MSLSGRYPSPNWEYPVPSCGIPQSQVEVPLSWGTPASQGRTEVPPNQKKNGVPPPPHPDMLRLNRLRQRQYAPCGFAQEDCKFYLLPIIQSCPSESIN